MEERLITELIEFVQAASPVVWAAARRQVSVEIVQLLFLMAVFVVMTASAFRIYIHSKGRMAAEDRWEHRSAWDEWNALTYFAIAATLLGLAACVAVVLLVIGPAMNPDYYAIKQLLDLIQ